MPRALGRKDFLIQDLVVSIGAGRGGDTYIPAEEGKLPPYTTDFADRRRDVSTLISLRRFAGRLLRLSRRTSSTRLGAPLWQATPAAAP